MSTPDREAGRNGVWPAERGYEVGTTGIARVAQEKCAKLARARLVAVNLVQADILKMKGAMKPGGLLPLQG